MNGNNIQTIQDCLTELNIIESFIKKDPLNSMVKYLVSYSVIKSSGTIEIVFKNIIFEHLIKNANQEAVTYFSKFVKESSCNPKIEKICSILKNINLNWNTAFKTTVIESDKQSLNSLVDLRNQLAHGYSITSSISDVKSYFQSGVNVLNILDSIVQ